VSSLSALNDELLIVKLHVINMSICDKDYDKLIMTSNNTIIKCSRFQWQLAM